MQLGKISLGSVFIIIGIIFLIQVEKHQKLAFEISDTAVDGMTYPRLLVYAWIGMSIIYLIKRADSKIDTSHLKQSIPAITKIAISIALYFFLFSYLGLSVSTFLFLLVFFNISNYKNWKKAIPIAAFCTFLTWLSFDFILGIPMPRAVFLDLLGW